MNRPKMMMLCLMITIAAAAQEKIDKIAKEIESKGVESTVVVRRNRESKKVYLRIQDYNFVSLNGKYANQLAEAFKKESENADHAVINKSVASRKNKTNTSATTKRYELLFTEKKTKKIYRLDITPSDDGNPSVRLRIIMRDNGVPANKGDYGVLQYDMLDLSDISNIMEKWSDKSFGNAVSILELSTDSLKDFIWKGSANQLKELNDLMELRWKELEKLQDKNKNSKKSKLKINRQA